MGTLIDTSVLIEAERGNLDLATKIDSSDEEFFISVITASELLHGLHSGAGSNILRTRSIFIESIFARFDLLPIDLAVARTHSRIWAELSMAGKMIGMNDLWIGSTCLTHGLRLVTFNLRHFNRITGLNVDVWQ